MLSRYRNLFIGLVVASYLLLFTFQALAVAFQEPYRNPRYFQMTAIFATNTAVMRAIEATMTAARRQNDATSTARATTTRRPTDAARIPQTGDASP
jgi:hypothetical protein